VGILGNEKADAAAKSALTLHVTHTGASISQPPPHQLGGLGERCKLPQQGPAKIDFYALFDPEKVTDGNKNHFCGCLCIVDS